MNSLKDMKHVTKIFFNRIMYKMMREKQNK